MPETPSPAPPHRVAVIGWTDEVAALLGDRDATLAVAAVGARGATELIRARTATNAPCFQHVAEMMRRVDYDLALFANDEARDLAAVAARRGAALAALPAGLSATALGALAEAAIRHDRPLHLLQPVLHGPAVALALRALEELGAPPLTRIAVDDPRGEIVALRTASALAARLAPAPIAVTAATAPAAAFIAAQIRGERRSLALIEAREHHTPSVTVEASANRGSMRLDLAPGRATVVVTEDEGHEREFAFDDQDDMTNDIERLLDPGAKPDDRVETLRQAALLSALESALGSGQTHVVARPDVRSMLRVLPGTGRDASPPAGRLRSVS